MTKTYKRKEYTNVEAFIYGTDKEPDWFMKLVMSGVIKQSLAGFDGFNNIIKLEFETKNGTSWGKTGDYVVKNGQGCVYPVLHDVFLELYEEV